MGILSKLRLWKRKKKKTKNNEFHYLGESPLQPIYDSILRDINEQLDLGLVKLTRYPDHVSLDIVDRVGLAIWQINKFNMTNWEKFKDEFKKEEDKEADT